MTVSDSDDTTSTQRCSCGEVATRGITAGGKSVWMCEACFNRRMRELTVQAKEGRLPKEREQHD